MLPIFSLDPEIYQLQRKELQFVYISNHKLCQSIHGSILNCNNFSITIFPHFQMVHVGLTASEFFSAIGTSQASPQ